MIGAYCSEKMGWRWLFWWQGAFALLVFVAMALLVRETRGSVLLEKRAARLHRETGKVHTTLAAEERKSFLKAVRLSVARPAWWLVSEPIVTCFSLWIG